MHTPVITPFQHRVYAALRAIPRGRVMTYRGLAQWVGCGSCQAVGQALKRNPDAPRVPCHRVITTGLTLGGYAGKRGGEAIRRKQALLEAEGVHVADGQLVDASRVWQPEGRFREGGTP